MGLSVSEGSCSGTVLCEAGRCDGRMVCFTTLCVLVLHYDNSLSILRRTHSTYRFLVVVNYIAIVTHYS